MIRALRRFLGDQRGVTAVEAAFVLPVTLVMIAGIIEYSRVLLAEHMIRDIVDEAARTAVVTGQAVSTVKNDVEDAVDGVSPISSYTVTVTSTTTLNVTVDGTFDPFFAGLLPEGVVDFTITAQYPQ